MKDLLRRDGLRSVAWNLAVFSTGIKSFPSNLRYWMNGSGDGFPIPPTSLIATVTGSRDVAWYLKSGKLAIESINKILARNGLSFDNFSKILDFGCGSGRVIRHQINLKNTEIYGTDLNSAAIEWCTRNLPHGHFARNQFISATTIDRPRYV